MQGLKHAQYTRLRISYESSEAHIHKNILPFVPTTQNNTISNYTLYKPYTDRTHNNILMHFQSQIKRPLILGNIALCVTTYTLPIVDYSGVY